MVSCGHTRLLKALKFDVMLGQSQKDPQICRCKADAPPERHSVVRTYYLFHWSITPTRSRSIGRKIKSSRSKRRRLRKRSWSRERTSQLLHDRMGPIDRLRNPSPQVSSSLFLQHNTALVPPYRVLIDTNFINFSLQNKLELISGMMDCLFAKCE